VPRRVGFDVRIGEDNELKGLNKVEYGDWMSGRVQRNTHAKRKIQEIGSGLSILNGDKQLK
jgi:hypothetical protein